MDHEDLGRLQRLAVRAAQAGGAQALERFAQPGLQVTLKEDDSPVTVADTTCEKTIRGILAAERPDDAVLGEEDGLQGDPGARYRWIVDPIDGTRNFIRGIPLWSTLVAIQDTIAAGQPVVASCVGLPALDQWFSAALGAGATCNDRPIRVSEVTDPADGLWCYESRSWFLRNDLEAVFNRLDEATGLQRGVCDAYGHMLIAAGHAEVIIEPELSIWDKAAPSLIVREAGGRFTDMNGTDDLAGPGAIISNGHLHGFLLDELRTAGPR
jgi:histidinol-phosphatase